MLHINLNIQLSFCTDNNGEWSVHVLLTIIQAEQFFNIFYYINVFFHGIRLMIHEYTYIKKPLQSYATVFFNIGREKYKNVPKLLSFQWLTHFVEQI